MAKRGNHELAASVEGHVVELLPELWCQIVMHLVDDGEFGATLNWMGTCRQTTTVLKPLLDAWLKRLASPWDRKRDDHREPNIFCIVRDRLTFYELVADFPCVEFLNRINATLRVPHLLTTGFYRDVIYNLHLAQLHNERLNDSSGSSPFFQPWLCRPVESHKRINSMFHFDPVTRQWTRLDKMPSVRVVDRLPGPVELRRIYRIPEMTEEQRQLIKRAVTSSSKSLTAQLAYVALKDSLTLVQPRPLSRLSETILGDAHILSDQAFCRTLYCHDDPRASDEAKIRELSVYRACQVRARRELERLRDETVIV